MKCDHNKTEPQCQTRNNNKIFINKIQIDVVLCVNLGLYILLFVFLHRTNAEHIERRHWLLLHQYTKPTYTRATRHTHSKCVRRMPAVRLYTLHRHTVRNKYKPMWIRSEYGAHWRKRSEHAHRIIHTSHGNKIVCSHASMWAFIQHHASIAHTLTLTRAHRTQAAVWNANRCSPDTRYFVSYVTKDNSENTAILLSRSAVIEEKGKK